MNTDTYQIKNFLCDNFRASEQPILGSYLGEILRKTFPEIFDNQFKRRHGSLHLFIKQVMGNDLVVVGMQGADTKFGLRGQRYQATPVKSQNDRPMWRVFTNPLLEGVLEIQNGNVILTPTSGSGFNIRRLSAKDHQDIINGFIETHVAKVHQTIFTTALTGKSEAEYWKSFSEALTASPPIFFDTWKDYRLAELRRIFGERCLEASGTMEPASIENCWDQLRGLTSAISTGQDSKHLNPTARGILAAALEKLSEEELSEVVLPTQAWIRLVQALK